MFCRGLRPERLLQDSLNAQEKVWDIFSKLKAQINTVVAAAPVRFSARNFLSEECSGRKLLAFGAVSNIHACIFS
jgi:hypothetical protein